MPVVVVGVVVVPVVVVPVVPVVVVVRRAGRSRCRHVPESPPEATATAVAPPARHATMSVRTERIRRSACFGVFGALIGCTGPPELGQDDRNVATTSRCGRGSLHGSTSPRPPSARSGCDARPQQRLQTRGAEADVVVDAPREQTVRVAHLDDRRVVRGGEPADEVGVAAAVDHERTRPPLLRAEAVAWTATTPRVSTMPAISRRTASARRALRRFGCQPYTPHEHPSAGTAWSPPCGQVACSQMPPSGHDVPEYGRAAARPGAAPSAPTCAAAQRPSTVGTADGSSSEVRSDEFLAAGAVVGA